MRLSMMASWGSFCRARCMVSEMTRWKGLAVGMTKVVASASSVARR